MRAGASKRSRCGNPGRRMTALLAVGVALAATACLSRDEQAEATQIALADPRLSELLASRTHMVTTVREPGGSAQGGPSDAVVEIEFTEGFPTSEYPLDVCDIGGHDGVVTGIMSLVDLDTDAVTAVTPVWGSVSCFDNI